MIGKDFWRAIGFGVGLAIGLAIVLLAWSSFQARPVTAHESQPAPTSPSDLSPVPIYSAE